MHSRKFLERKRNELEEVLDFLNDPLKGPTSFEKFRNDLRTKLYSQINTLKNIIQNNSDMEKVELPVNTWMTITDPAYESLDGQEGFLWIVCVESSTQPCTRCVLDY